ncbi:WD repeat, SAM and U-box domain-containing protein 1-like isoform X2 [Corythoichthys intestinalis]|uniref:WD repeat, SAM and U-box domain-containing protein 1-like isoform X2 n=1 Tax=Corythoichthys intestinalis TaxID=161448 RepID=UPI0025A53414|nr:WD repeat, SAM and U-box domain-containing protein 1-like isoform X2 [Corythoichthys intestinalis]
MLATGSGDKSLRLYNVADLSELPCSPLSGHGYGVRSCCFTPSGDYLLSCSADGSVLVWSSKSGEVESELRHPERSPLRVCAIAPDASLLMAGASDGTLALWDFPSRTLIRCNTVSEASVAACCFSPCGRTLVTGCTLGDLRLWDVDGALMYVEKDAHDLGVTCCTFAPQFEVDDSHVHVRLASCGQDSRLMIWMVTRLQGHAYVIKLLHALSSQSAPVLCCAFSSDGQLVVSGSVDKSVAVYDTESGTLLHTLKQHDRYVTAVALSPSIACLMATGSMDRTVNVWMIGDGHNETRAELEQPVCQGRKQPSRSSRSLLPDWSREDVQDWLREEGLDAELAAVFQANGVDGRQLEQLSEDAVLKMGIESVEVYGVLLRRIQALKVEQSTSDCPDEFMCPISRELMKEPVIASDGFSYERESIESWIKGKNRSSPMTNLPLQTTVLTPNRALKMAISRWKGSQQQS